MKTDKLDRKILLLLVKDGRMSSAEIARRLHENERKVAYRVKNLIERGAISILGVIRGEFFGYEITATVSLDVEPSKISQAAQEVARLPEISYVDISFGEHDVNCQTMSRSPSDLFEFVSKKLSQIDGVRRVTTSIVPVVVKEIHEWIPPEVRHK